MKKIFLPLLMLFVMICEPVLAEKLYRTARVQMGDRKLGDFLRDRNGDPITNVTRERAAEICRARGMRLPKAIEIALDQVADGLAVISEVKYDSSRFPPGYSSSDFLGVDAKDAPGVDFYSSDKKYKLPPGELGRYWIWSSSDLNFLFRDRSIILPILGYPGNVYYVSDQYRDSNFSAVRCMTL